MRLLDTKTNEILDLSTADNPDAVISGIFSGELAPDRDALYKVKLPGGRVSEVGGGELDGLLKQGATFYGKNDLARDQEVERFESIPQQAAAAGLGTARGLSLGLSDLALTKTGIVSPEYLQKQEEYNPEISTAGEIAGALAPALFSGGTSTAANILAKTPAGIANIAGREAAQIGSRVAAKAIPGALNPVVSSAVKKATELGLGSAAESALYGAGDAVSESAIQNKPLTAEAVLADVGYKALTGGLLGGGLGATADLAGKGIKKAAGKVAKIVDESGDLESRLVARGLGANKREMGVILGSDFKQENINHVYKAIQNGVDEIGSSGSFANDFNKIKDSKLGLESITKGNDELISNVEKLKKRAGDAISKSLDSVDQLKSTDDVLKSLESAGGDIGKLDFTNKDKLKNFIDRTRAELSEINPTTGEVTPRNLSAKELWDLRRQLDDVIYDDKINSGARTKFGEVLEGARRDIEKNLEEMLSSNKSILDEYKSAKKAYAGASDIEKLIESQNAKAANNMFGLTAYDSGAAGAMIGGAPGAALGFLGRKAIADYGDKAALYVLSNLEKRAGAINKAVDESINGLMTASRKAGTIGSIAASQDKGKTYDSKVKELEMQQQRIDEIRKGLDESLGAMGSAAPETALMLRDKTLNAMDFLNSKLPMRPEVNPLVSYQVPESEIDKFNRYAMAVENPNTIMKNLKGGYISPEEVEVLKKVYPEIHTKLKSKALDLLASKKQGKELNYQLRIQLQKLLDTKSDVNLYPTSIKTLQQSFQNPQQNQQSSAPAKLPGSRAKGLNLGASFSSGLESTLRRRNS